MSVLSIENLSVTIDLPCGPTAVLERLSLELEEGKTLALVGESGCGKSMTALAIMGLLPLGFKRSEGTIFVNGLKVSALSLSELRRCRGRQMAMIFQEPMTALNPLYTIGEQIVEVLRLHQGLSRKQAKSRVVDLLAEVNISAPEKRINDYPHQFSGGMRQRVMIVMAMASKPDLLIADEPTTALDVTVETQIFDLLKKMQKETKTAVLLITHNLNVAADIAENVAVLYAGRCLEYGQTENILNRPQHPYTKGLLKSAPILRLGPEADKQIADLTEIPGQLPKLEKRPRHCIFASRCRELKPNCQEQDQPFMKPRQNYFSSCCN